MATGEEGALGSLGAGSGRIRARHWLSISAAVGVRSGRSGRSWNSRRGGREPSWERPSPQAGEFLRKLEPSLLRGRPPSRPATAATGERGPLRSQLPKSRALPSPSNWRLLPRALPVSETLSGKSRLKPPRSLPRRGRSGRGPLRDQSLKSREEAESLAIRC